MNHVKAMTQESWYNINAWRYNSEYAAHMYGWTMFKSAYGNNTIWYDFASRLRYAEIDKQKWESGDNWWRNIIYALFGVLGI